MISLRSASLPKGQFVRLQPHSSDFLDIRCVRSESRWLLHAVCGPWVLQLMAGVINSKKLRQQVGDWPPPKADHCTDPSHAQQPTCGA